MHRRRTQLSRYSDTVVFWFRHATMWGSMRKTLVALAALIIAAPIAVARQDPPGDEKLPKKGDTVVVTGCLEGAVLESKETVSVDESGATQAFLSYRLTGKKELLKQLRDGHNGRVVEVTGVLKSTIQPPGQLRGKQVGKNTRIVVGIGSGQQPLTPEMPMLPVLDVRSWTGLASFCRP